MKLSATEFERLVELMPEKNPYRGPITRETQATLLANNCPTVARNWLREEGLLDEQQSPAIPGQLTVDDAIEDACLPAQEDRCRDGRGETDSK